MLFCEARVTTPTSEGGVSGMVERLIQDPRYKWIFAIVKGFRNGFM